MSDRCEICGGYFSYADLTDVEATAICEGKTIELGTRFICIHCKAKLVPHTTPKDE